MFFDELCQVWQVLLPSELPQSHSIQFDWLMAGRANKIALREEGENFDHEERHPFGFPPMLPGAFAVTAVAVTVECGAYHFGFPHPSKNDYHWTLSNTGGGSMKMTADS
jgi:hypothetical protein